MRYTVILILLAALAVAAPLVGTGEGAEGQENLIDGKFIINGDGTVSDVSTRRLLGRGYADAKGSTLMWQRSGNENMPWQEAMLHCEALELAGHKNWRLPSLLELMDLVEKDKKTRPKINTDVFPETKSARYWTGKERRPERPEDAEFFGAYFVDFKKGREGAFGAHRKYYIRCVREVRTE